MPVRDSIPETWIAKKANTESALEWYSPSLTPLLSYLQVSLLMKSVKLSTYTPIGGNISFHGPIV